VAAVLAGGASRRMGRDKALLAIDGLPMVRRVVDAAVAAGAAKVIVVGGDVPALAVAVGDAATVVADHHPGEGPLGGLITAFQGFGQRGGGVEAGPTGPGQQDRLPPVPPPAAVLFGVSCDLVAPEAGAMRATVDALRAHDADVAAPEIGGTVQWLHAAWRTSTVARALAERFAAGERSVHRAVRQAGLRLVEVPGLAPAELADADTPADLDGHGGQHPEWH
jgi:molybdopterin-guanine dinucleotide biosynthesis protein A